MNQTNLKPIKQKTHHHFFGRLPQNVLVHKLMVRGGSATFFVYLIAYKFHQGESHIALKTLIIANVFKDIAVFCYGQFCYGR
jgi:hypothetical protein